MLRANISHASLFIKLIRTLGSTSAELFLSTMAIRHVSVPGISKSTHGVPEMTMSGLWLGRSLRSSRLVRKISMR